MFVCACIHILCAYIYVICVYGCGGGTGIEEFKEYTRESRGSGRIVTSHSSGYPPFPLVRISSVWLHTDIL